MSIKKGDLNRPYKVNRQPSIAEPSPDCCLGLFLCYPTPDCHSVKLILINNHIPLIYEINADTNTIGNLLMYILYCSDSVPT